MSRVRIPPLTPDEFLLLFPRLDLIAVFTGRNIHDKPALDLRFALERVLEDVKTKP